MPLSILLQTLEMNQSGGELAISVSGCVVGRIWLDRGEVVDASFGDAAGEDAVYRMLGVDEGWFRLDFGTADCTRTIHAGTQALLLEGLRRLDETRRVVTERLVG